MAWPEPTARGFYGQFRDPESNKQYVLDGEGKPRRFARKKDALCAARDEEAKIRQGTWWDPTHGAVTFADYFEKHWFPNKVVGVNTTRRYDEQYDNRNWGLKQYWGEVELRHITATAVQTWVAKMVRAGVSAATVQARFKAFQTVQAGGTIGTRKRGTSALKEGLIARNPCVGIELPFVPKPDVRVYTPDQVDHLLPFIDEWYRPIPLFLAETAVRWGEMLGLQVDDFALGFRSFVVRRTILEPGTRYTHKGTPFEVQPYPNSKRPRMVKLSRPAATGVQALIAARGLGPGTGSSLRTRAPGTAARTAAPAARAGPRRSPRGIRSAEPTSATGCGSPRSRRPGSRTGSNAA